jgi:hypothetical protein
MMTPPMVELTTNGDDAALHPLRLDRLCAKVSSLAFAKSMPLS